MSDRLNLEGKRYLVAGASSGIGRAIAIECGNLGASVVLLARRAEKLAEVAGMIPEGMSTIITCDLSDSSGLPGLFESISSNGEKLDGMVYCAGVASVVPLKMLTREKLDEVMAVNFYSYVEMCREFVKKTNSNDWSSIVAISALLVDSPRPFELAYVSSKAAMEAASRVMALEYAKRGMRFNCLSPGSVRTEMVEGTINGLGNREEADAFAARSLFGWQEPEDVASVCAFLLSDAASQITGKTIKADGGYV